MHRRDFLKTAAAGAMTG
ncbi:MAG: twin-arginine translocation signal domain-containing protein, partial [Gemmatimonadetes bacterium]|nr:twin-arginine translocation signal domain-containing protein [Gemmatimonadota bacterium]